MNDISDDEEEDTGLLNHASARDSLALQAYLRERKLGGGGRGESSPAQAKTTGASSVNVSPAGRRATMNLDELDDNTVTVLTPGLRVKTNFSSTRGSPPKRDRQAGSPARQVSPTKRFDEGGGVYVEDSTRSLRSMVKKSYEEKRQYQQTIHEKQLEIESLKKSFLEMTTRCERLNLLMNRSKKVLLPSRVSFMLERWATRFLYFAFHRWMNVVSDYSAGAMRHKEAMMNIERQDWLTVRGQWAKRRGEMSSTILLRSVRSMLHARLSKSFRKWHSAVSADKHCALVRELWVAPINDRARVRIMFSRWKSLLAKKNGAVKLLTKVISRLCFRAMLAAWNTWKAQNRQMDRQREKFLKGISLLSASGPTARCLEKWRRYAFVSEPRRLRLYSIMCTSTNHKARHEQRQCFNSWKQTSKAIGLIPCRVSDALTRSEHILTRSYLRRWSRSAKGVSRLILALSSLARCAKDSSAALQKEGLSRWYRASCRAQISELRGALQGCKQELAECHKEIGVLSSNLSTAQQGGLTKSGEYVDTMKRSALRRIIIQAMRQSRWKYFSMWRLASSAETSRIEGRRVQLITNVASKMIICGKGTISTAFRMWSLRTVSCREGGRRLCRFVAVMRVGLSLRFLRHWVLVTARARRSEEAKALASKRMVSVTMRLLKAQLSLGMDRWVCWLRADRDKRSGAAYVRRLLANGSARQAFMRWKSAINTLMRQEHASFSAMARAKQHTHAVYALRRLLGTHVAAFWLNWRQFVAARVGARQQVRRLGSGAARRRLAGGFCMWRAAVGRCKAFGRHTERLTRSFNRYIHSATHSAFMVWKSFSARKKEFDTFSDKLFFLEDLVREGDDKHTRLHHTGRERVVLSHVFQAWRQSVLTRLTQGSSKGRVMASCIRRMQRQQMFSCFNAWVSKVNTGIRLENVMKKSLSRLVYQKLDVAMKTWSRNVFIMTSDSHISFLRHTNQLHISVMKAEHIVHRMFNLVRHLCLSLPLPLSLPLHSNSIVY
jgi:hypothetical protein